MKITNFTLIVLSIYIAIHNLNFAQNLVQNPGFESISSCPTGISQLSNAPFWNVLNQYGTPDLYNNGGACNYLPSNSSLGTNLPHTGNGMAGIYCYRTTSSNREYCVNSLSSPMVVGQAYTVSFWVSLATASGWSINNLGVYFSVSNPPCSNTTAPCLAPSVVMSSVTPQLLVNSAITTSWVQYSFTFTPTAAFNRMTIGRFAVDNPSNQLDIPPIGNTAYILVDDFVVTPLVSLPVNISDFTATCDNTTNIINWSSEYEVNNDLFMLEKSCDGIHFEEIASIKGQENSNHTTNYSYSDNVPCDGYSYYKLSQIDVDGTIRTVNTISENCHRESNFLLYPNPVSNVLTVSIGKTPIQKIQLIDVFGKIIAEESFQDGVSNTSIVFQLDDKMSGVYTVKCITEQHGFINQKVIKL
jgi:Secretion system C-terminal sorting domain